MKNKNFYNIKKYKRKDRGITLVALVITIVILLILAGITIIQLTESGLFGKAKISKMISDYEAAKERIEIELMEVQADCIGSGREYTILEIAKNIKEDIEITIEKYYNENISLIKTGVEENIVNLNGIVVSVNKYSEYKFLIGKNCKIDGVTTDIITDEITIEDFKEINEFEKDIFGNKIEFPEEPLVEIAVIDDINEFTETIKNQEKLEYIINNPEIFMNKILEETDIFTILLKNDNAVDLIIKNDIWRSEILKSNNDNTGENSSIIKALDASDPINLPTTNLELYDSTNKTGNVLYSSYLRNSNVHTPINAFIGGSPGTSDWETESNGLPAYIGYDFGEGNEVWIYKTYVRPGNNTYPTKMYLQSSDDNITWNTIYEYNRYVTDNAESTEVINSENNNKKSRYWRLYITQSGSGSYVDLLKIQFYGK